MTFRVALLVTALSFTVAGCGSNETKPPPQSSVDVPAEKVPERDRYLVGIWQWQWTSGVLDQIVLRDDGAAEKYRGTELANDGGKWHVDSEGQLQVAFPNDDLTMSFRIDSEFSITDIATLPTERDFPWFKVHKLASSLSKENLIAPPKSPEKKEPENAATNQEDKTPGDSIACGEYAIKNGTYLFNFKVDNFTQGMLVDLEVIEKGFVLSGGKLDPLKWTVDGDSVAFSISNDANSLSGNGKVTRNNFAKGSMNQGPSKGTFTLELQATERPFKKP